MNITYNNIVDIIRNFQNEHLQIESFGYGDVKSIGKTKDVKYPMLFVNPTNSVLGEGATSRLSFNILLMDRLQDSLNNEQEIHSDMLSIASDLRSYLQRSASDYFTVTDTSNIYPFTERFGDNVGGWNFECTIESEWDFSICEIPGISDQQFDNQGNIIITNYRDLLANYMPLSGGTFSGGIYSPSISGATYYSGSTPLTTIIQNIASQNSSSTSFSAGTNLELVTGSTYPNVIYSLANNIHIGNLIADDIISETETVNKFLYAGSGVNQIGINGLTGVLNAPNIQSGGTNINDIFSHSNHTHSLSQILNTAHTHSISSITSLTSILSDINNSLNTKANISGNTTFSAATISANRFNSGGTNLTSIFVGQGEYDANNILINASLETKANISGNTSFSASSLSAQTYYSGATDLSNIFATQSTVDANTASINSNTASIATKANISGNTSFSATSLSAQTYYSGSTPLSSLFVLTANTPYDVSYYRKRGANMTRWYHSGINAVANSTASLAKDIIRYTPFIVPVTQSAITIACEVTTFGTAGAVARLGIFNSITNTSSAYHMQPDTPIADCGTVAIDSNGVKSITGLNIELTPGLYFLAMNHNSATSTTFRALGQSSCPALFGMGVNMGSTNGTHLTEVKTYGAFSASTNNLVAVATTLPPILAFQVG